jgi:hypothetical protein
MASKRENRRQKKNAKAKTKAKKRSTHASRGSNRTSASLAKAGQWPTGDCYLSQNWTDWGQTVHAIFTRRHDSGRLAVALFEIDMARRGIINVRATAQYDEFRLGNDLDQRSSDDSPLLVVEPELIVKLVMESYQFGVSSGHGEPQGYAKSIALFGSITASDSDQFILLGNEDEDGPTEDVPREPSSEGWLSSIKRAVGLGS